VLHAAGKGAVRIMKLLLARGADIEAQDEEGKTALMLAAREGQSRMVELLLAHGAKADHADNQGKTVLMYAAGGAGEGISAGAVRQTGGAVSAGPALPQQQKEDDTRILTLLLTHGAKVSAADKFGSTALTYAMQNNRMDVAKILLAHGARADDGLAAAVASGNVVMLQLLLHEGGNPNLPVRGQGSLHHYARTFRSQNPQILHLLEQAGAKE
jgi:ankyrin repeat protein